MNTRCQAWIYLFCFSLSAGFAQQSAPAGQPESPAPVPSAGRSRSITLDVVVTDKSGKPVPGLQQQDFTLLDNKQPTKIVSFDAIQSGAAKADPPVEIVVLVDEVNSSFRAVAVAREEIEKFLKQNGGQLEYPVSLVFLSDMGVTGTASSRDGNALVAELDQNKAGLRIIGKNEGFYGAGDRVQLSLHALEQFAGYEAPKPGRKLVIWLSPGWPLLTGPRIELTSKQQQGLFANIVALSDAMRQARITLYSIDPLGMSDARGLRATYYEDYVKGVKKASQVNLANLALQVIATQSGGRVFIYDNDLSGEITKSIADANAFYVLTFDGLRGDGPNEYHSLEVKIDKSGLAARTRTGYYAQP